MAKGCCGGWTAPCAARAGSLLAATRITHGFCRGTTDFSGDPYFTQLADRLIGRIALGGIHVRGYHTAA